MTGRAPALAATMQAVYRQARAVLDKAAAATNKDQKTAQISLLVELCAYRGDSALVAEVVEGVAGYAADRSAKVRKAVVEFVDAVVARGKLQVTDECASTALATCCVLAVDENEPVAAAAVLGGPEGRGGARVAAPPREARPSPPKTSASLCLARLRRAWPGLAGLSRA